MNQSQLKMLEKVAVGILREGLSTIFRAPIYRVHHAVIFAA